MGMVFGGRSREELEDEFLSDRSMFMSSADAFEEYKREIDKAIDDGEDISKMTKEDIVARMEDD